MLNWKGYGRLEIGTWPALEAVAPELRVWTASRKGGASSPPFDSLNLGDHVGDARSKVLTNRRSFIGALGISPRRVVRGGQVHGSRIVVVDRAGILKGTDGFVTRSRDLALVINTADCFPLFLHSPSEMVLAALHVGRNGAGEGIVKKAMRTLFTRFEADPSNLIAVCGPGICRECYEVGGSEARPFPPETKRRVGGRYYLDLPAFIRGELLAAGVKSSNYFEAGICTSCSPDRFFSYRRDGGRTGRHWSVAMMKSAP
jgi:YfiH family protein